MKTFLFSLVALGVFGCTAGGGGGSDGGEAALGEACGATSDCAAGQCISVGGDNFCSQACSANNPCPGGYDCRQNYCMPGAGGGLNDMGVGGSGGGAGGGEGGAGGGDGGAGGGAGGAGGGAGGAGGGAGGAGGGGGAELSCSAIFQCLGGCQDQACAQGCIDQASPAAAGQFNDLQQCLATNCADVQNDEAAFQACAQEQCGPAFDTCLGGGGGGGMPAGTDTCTEFNTCLNGCGPDDQACIEQCVADASPEAFQQYNEVVECAQTNNCFNRDSSADQACINANCGNEYDACFAPSGDGTCDEFLGCLNQCQDAACQQMCVQDVSAEGLDQYNAIVQCAQDNGCVDAQGAADGACLEANCGAEFETCVGELPEPMGDAGCNETLMCSAACADQACANQCLEAASPAGFDLFIELIGCLTENECEGVPCPPCNDQIGACEAN